MSNEIEKLQNEFGLTRRKKAGVGVGAGMLAMLAMTVVGFGIPGLILLFVAVVLGIIALA